MTAVLSGKDHPLSLIFVLKGLVEYLVSSRIDRSGVANMADRNYGPSFKERRSRRPVMLTISIPRAIITPMINRMLPSMIASILPTATRALYGRF
jgi:hypothetical protein